MALNPELASSIADALAERSWWLGDGLLPAALVEALALQARQPPAPMRRAGIGRAEAARVDASLRGDSILWLDTETPAAAACLAALDALRLALNRHLFLGLRRVEAHYAHYSPGARYVRHRDAFARDNPRVVSVVLYLNRDWPADAGGELVLYPDAMPAGLRVLPEQGRVAIFMSQDIEHEVLPARLDRYSIAAWMRRDEL